MATVPRANLVADLYVKELRAFKPTPISAADVEGAVKPWNTPAAPKAPSVEGAADVAEYAAAEVEVSHPAPAAETVEDISTEEFFVLEEPVEDEPHH